ncbi:hypothetical protein AN958_03787 [Leucoagaricus sp. SymC.cos]|nr:hypothetical protein AN958_03787 [Leucoagaricus sp. SymC.cos]
MDLTQVDLTPLLAYCNVVVVTDFDDTLTYGQAKFAASLTPVIVPSIVAMLASIAHNGRQVVIALARGTEVLDEHFGDIPNIQYIANKGYVVSGQLPPLFVPDFSEITAAVSLAIQPFDDVFIQPEGMFLRVIVSNENPYFSDVEDLLQSYAGEGLELCAGSEGFFLVPEGQYSKATGIQMLKPTWNDQPLIIYLSDGQNDIPAQQLVKELEGILVLVLKPGVTLPDNVSVYIDVVLLDLDTCKPFLQHLCQTLKSCMSLSIPKSPLTQSARFHLDSFCHQLNSIPSVQRINWLSKGYPGLLLTFMLSGIRANRALSLHGLTEKIIAQHSDNYGIKAQLGYLPPVCFDSLSTAVIANSVVLK